MDNVTEQYIQNAIEKLAKGRTTIIVAHRLSTIKNADEILVLTDQGIAERGSHEQLMNQQGIYYTLFQAQYKGQVKRF
jgi:ATP-binding cassette subfamily B protein